MIRKFFIPFCLSLVFMCNENKVIVHVDEDECTPILEPIEVVYPKGGETFKVGDSKTIQWKVNPQVIQQVQVQVSLDDEKTWKEVYERGKNVTDTGNVECMSATWIIGSEVPPVNYSSTNTVTLRVGKYGAPDDVFDSSEKFSVVK